MRSFVLAAAVLTGSSAMARADAPGATPPVTPGASEPAATAPALAPVASGEQAPIQVGPDPTARTPAIVATVATGALLVATVVIYEHRESLAKIRGLDTNTGLCDAACLAEKESRAQSIDRYKKAYIGTAVGAIVAGGIAGYLWTKATEKTFVRPPRMTLSVEPGQTTLAFDGRF